MRMIGTIIGTFLSGSIVGVIKAGKAFQDHVKVQELEEGKLRVLYKGKIYRLEEVEERGIDYDVGKLKQIRSLCKELLDYVEEHHSVDTVMLVKTTYLKRYVDVSIENCGRGLLT